MTTSPSIAEDIGTSAPFLLLQPDTAELPVAADPAAILPAVHESGDPQQIHIGIPFVTTQAGRTKISCVILNNDRESVLWYEVEESFADYLSTDTSDAFLAAALVAAIEGGCDIRVAGPVSAKLYYNLSNYLIPVLSDYLGHPRKTRIFANALLSNPAQRGTGVAAGFSGGIDSFSNFHDHSGGRVPQEFALTHFLFNNVGSHGQRSAGDDRAVFAARHRQLKDCAAALEKPVIAVDSNLDQFMGGKFQLTHTLRNATVALLMQNAFAKFMYSSGYALDETRVGPDYNMSRLDPVILPWLGTERLECIASGGQHTRVDKTARVIHVPASRQYLDVCVNPGNAPTGFANCGMCWKCIRTAITLKAYGQLDNYGRVFPRAHVDLFESLYLIEVIGGSSPFAREIRELMSKTGYPVPRLVRLIAALSPSFLAQQMSIRVIPFLIRQPRLARLARRILSW